MPEPEPEPKPLGQPANLRVADRGLDFIVWEWDPVEGATAYQGDVGYPRGTFVPPEKEPPPVWLEEPIFRLDGLSPGASVYLFVRAARETAGRVELGPWSESSGYVWTETEPLPMPACEDMRGIAEGLRMKVVLGWDTTPIRVWVEPAFPDFVREQVAVFAAKLENHLGYPVLDATVTDDISTADIQVVYKKGVRSAAASNGMTPPAVLMNPSKPHDEIGVSFIEHEASHLFGMGHNTCRGDVQPDWVPMSMRLSCGDWAPNGEHLLGVVPSDLDTIGCIFPEEGP